MSVFTRTDKQIYFPPERVNLLVCPDLTQKGKFRTAHIICQRVPVSSQFHNSLGRLATKAVNCDLQCPIFVT